MSVSTKREQGFTLIELLVVMIIISILMAVAVPTFLSQKNTALKTQATANIKHIVNAIESCAAQIPSGGYVAPAVGATAGLSCLDGPTLEGFEKTLKNLNIVATSPTVGEYQVLSVGSDQGYLIQTAINDSGKTVYFAEVHEADGTLHKVCKTQADGAGSSAYTNDAAETYAGVADPSTKTCQTGTW